MTRLLVDSAYVALSIAALVMLLSSASPRRALDEFGQKCELDIMEARPPNWGMGLANALVAAVSLARKALIHYIFGRLTANEVHHSYDRILNFVLFKVVSVRATLDADWEDLAIWTVAYCCFGALYLIGGLARDHLESLRLSPAQSGVRWGFVGLMSSLI
ncbi:hypothetical protein GGI21_005907, partial [Coemansia aciculifera]